MASGSAVWHPNTQMSEWDGFDEIVRGAGMHLVDRRGRKLLDGVSSMWCNVWGYARPELIRAMRRQAAILPHSPLFNLTHAPAERLAKMLVKMAPGMAYAYYSDSGSAAMEIAIKMAIQYRINEGEKRPVISSLEGGYHGDTLGAMSAGYSPEFFSKFKRYTFHCRRFAVPNQYRLPRRLTLEERQMRCLDVMERAFARGDTAALIMESGAQIAGGAMIYPPGFQRQISRLCHKYGVLLVLDEIATGFGRLGSMAEYAAQGAIPDIVSYGKMMTGGYMSMAATLATKKVHDSFLGRFEDQRHLFHGHTYTGNPIAAALAIENINLYKKERLIPKVARSARLLARHVKELASLEKVGDVRHAGMLMGIELVSDERKKTPVTAAQSINKIVFEAGKRRGVYLRTLGNIILLVPPLAMPDSQLDELVERTGAVIRDVGPALH